MHHISVLFGTMIRADSTHLTEADALRGIAALVVACVYHLSFLLGTAHSGPLDGLPLATWLYKHGWTMVDMFFVISGFVFSHVYLENDRLRQGVTARSFLVARVARLYPLHLLTLLLLVPLLALGFGGPQMVANFDLYHFFLNLVMLQESGLNEGFSFNPATWSLSVEVFCYIIFLGAALAGGRVVPILAAAMIVLGLYLATQTGKSEIHIGRGFVGFFAGYFARRLRDKNISTVVLAAIFIAPFVWRPGGISTGAVLGISAFPAAVLLAERIPLFRLQVFQWLGQRSYSIYLWHTLVYHSVRAILWDGGKADPTGWYLTIAVAFLLLFTIADLSYRYFETPMRRWVRQVLDGPAVGSLDRSVRNS